ncbi:MAG: hypothetical protein RL682_2344 [Pseudomonadota bacterium]|jgi:hypothetical protein
MWAPAGKPPATVNNAQILCDFGDLLKLIFSKYGLIKRTLNRAIVDV